MFGANTLAKLSVKKHADLFKVLAARFEGAEVKAYYEHLKGIFDSP